MCPVFAPKEKIHRWGGEGDSILMMILLIGPWGCTPHGLSIYTFFLHTLQSLKECVAGAGFEILRTNGKTWLKRGNDT